jgi:O-antigen ligase
MMSDFISTPAIRIQPGMGWETHRLPGVRKGVDLFVAASLLALVSFSLPGREVPDSASSLDFIALIKVAIRIGVVTWFGTMLLQEIYAQVLERVARGKGSPANYLFTLKWTSPILVPWMAYAGWSFLSLMWTPLKSVSAGQWLGLAAMLLFAQVIYMRTSQKSRSSGSTDRSQNHIVLPWHLIISQIGWVLFFYSLFVLIIHLVAPQHSGLDRDIFQKGNDGVVQPTAAGATASLGLVLAVVMLSLRGLKGQTWLVATCLVHAPVLIFSVSRAALATAVLCILLSCTLLLGRQVRGLLIAAIGLVMLVAVLIDPGFELLGKAIQGTSQYVQRGQTSAQLRAVSGRAEMWEAIWKEIAKSPLVGHGYFVTSEAGQFLMWGSRANHDAHHVFLQVLVTTGLIGALLFTWALLVAVYRLTRLLWRSPQGSNTRNLGWLLLILGVWYLGWGQGCTTFVGPIRPESVLFFASLGLLAAATATEFEAPRAELQGCQS